MASVCPAAPGVPYPRRAANGIRMGAVRNGRIAARTSGPAVLYLSFGAHRQQLPEHASSSCPPLRFLSATVLLPISASQSGMLRFAHGLAVGMTSVEMQKSID